MIHFYMRKYLEVPVTAASIGLVLVFNLSEVWELLNYLMFFLLCLKIPDMEQKQGVYTIIMLAIASSDEIFLY